MLSYCNYLLKIGLPYATVDSVVQIATNMREQDRKGLLPGARSINAAIVKLVTIGWTLNRATEIFFHGELSIAFGG
jgi:hypothetical protein